MLYNVHSHHPAIDNEIFCVQNIGDDFDQDVTGRHVSMGLHPWYLHEVTWRGALEILQVNAVKSEVLAIGECGLDKLTAVAADLQLNVFRQQIVLAEQIHKPLVIHCVRAFSEVLVELKQVKVPVIFHGVNNKLSMIEPVIDSGHYLSFGKALLNKNGSILDTFMATPLDKIFLETDDASTDIREIYKSAALIKKISEKEIVLQLEKNFETVFR